MATPEQARAPNHLTLDGVVSHWARLRPEAAALSWQGPDGETKLTWRSFEAAIEAVASHLEKEVSGETPVAVVCSNDAVFQVLLNALWRIGAGVLLIDRNWGPAIVADLLSLLDCRDVYAPAAWGLAAPEGCARRDYPELGGEPSAGVRRPRHKSIDSVAIYATTSGTTDNPKCVAVTHAKIRSAYDICLRVHDLSAVGMSGCLFDVTSLGILGVCFLLPREVGAGARIGPSFALSRIARDWRAQFESDVDFIYLVPPVVRVVNRLAPLQGRRRLAFCSSAPVTALELATLEQRFPVNVFNIYGLTELTFAVFFGCRDDNGGPSASIGPPVGIDARLVDGAGVEIVGAGEGELLIGGSMLCDGYVNNAEGTAASWSQGRLKTGDLARRDEAGRFFITGRLKDVALRGGFTYHLSELEHYLRRAPGVVDACAFRGAELMSGDELCAVVQVEQTVDASFFIDWIRENMGAAKVPNALFVWTKPLPRNSNGKVLRPHLAALHQQGLLRDELSP